MPERGTAEQFQRRTEAFFGQSPAILARQLQDVVIQVEGTNRAIRLTSLESWRLSQVGKRYSPMQEMKLGDLWAPPVRTMRQSLIVAQDMGRVGACVRILRAATYDPGTSSYVEMVREGQTAEYLGMDKNVIASLRFVDESDTLYLSRGRSLSK